MTTISRGRWTKTFVKNLKYTFKPTPTDEQRLWSRKTVNWLRHHADLQPDAYARISDFTTVPMIPEADISQIQRYVIDDRHRRFQLKSEPPLDRNKEVTWYIRAREGHTIPGVSISTIQVTSPAGLPSVIYSTRPDVWNHIEKYGIRPEFPTCMKHTEDNFIHLARHLTTISSLQSVPRPVNTDYQSIQLHITLDVAQAIKSGIKFFVTKDGAVLSTGQSADRSIPSTFFKSVEVVVLKKEVLHVKNEDPESRPRDNSHS